MHMADALLSPTVGIAGWVAGAGLVGAASRRITRATDTRRVPLMGVLGAFVFAAQMINFSIPGTGSSGHLGGGLLLAVLLGPWTALLVMASILAIQALFFADGGLLAWGCNVINLGLFPCLVAFPLVYRPLVGNAGAARRAAGAVLAATVGLEMGALGVVTETSLSGIAHLPFGVFAAVMLPIHLAIGIVEGLATAAILAFLERTEPGLLQAGSDDASGGRRTLVALGVLALLAAGAMSWFASAQPDGLEWSIARVMKGEEPGQTDPALHAWTARVQEKTSFLPGYDFASAPDRATEPRARWPDVKAGTSLSGILGGLTTLLLIGLIGLALRGYQRWATARSQHAGGEPPR